MSQMILSNDHYIKQSCLPPCDLKAARSVQIKAEEGFYLLHNVDFIYFIAQGSKPEEVLYAVWTVSWASQVYLARNVRSDFEIFDIERTDNTHQLIAIGKNILYTSFNGRVQDIHFRIQHQDGHDTFFCRRFGEPQAEENEKLSFSPYKDEGFFSASKRSGIRLVLFEDITEENQLPYSTMNDSKAELIITDEKSKYLYAYTNPGLKRYSIGSKSLTLTKQKNLHLAIKKAILISSLKREIQDPTILNLQVLDHYLLIVFSCTVLKENFLTIAQSRTLELQPRMCLKLNEVATNTCKLFKHKKTNYLAVNQVHEPDTQISVGLYWIHKDRLLLAGTFPIDQRDSYFNFMFWHKSSNTLFVTGLDCYLTLKFN